MLGKTKYLAASLIILIAGCATQSQPPAPAPAVNLSGYPLAFRQGYTDGCASARPGAARQRDDASYKADANYAQGWRDGLDICRSRK